MEIIIASILGAPILLGLAAVIHGSNKEAAFGFAVIGGAVWLAYGLS